MTLLFFAHYQDVVGSHELAWPVPTPATVGALAVELEREYPSLGDLLTTGRVAVDAEFASAETPLADNAEVAWMPPMSGGSGAQGFADY